MAEQEEWADDEAEDEDEDGEEEDGILGRSGIATGAKGSWAKQAFDWCNCEKNKSKPPGWSPHANKKQKKEQPKENRS